MVVVFLVIRAGTHPQWEDLDRSHTCAPSSMVGVCVVLWGEKVSSRAFVVYKYNLDVLCSRTSTHTQKWKWRQESGYGAVRRVCYFGVHCVHESVHVHSTGGVTRAVSRVIYMNRCCR